MASDQSFVDFVVDQLSGAGNISYKMMFGEYGLYSGNKYFGSVCDNRLFIKPTDAGRKYIQNVIEAPPYPGAKLSFLIEDKLDDREWLAELVKNTVKELPEPKPRKSKKR